MPFPLLNIFAYKCINKIKKISLKLASQSYGINLKQIFYITCHKNKKEYPIVK
jgi:hypothetical protein